MKTLILYAIEVLACSGVLLAAYSFLLERRVAFRWCRAYLLTATLLAAVIPLLRLPVWPGGVTELIPVASIPIESGFAAHAETVEAATSAVTPETLCLVFCLLGAGLLVGLMIAQALSIRRLRRGAEISRSERFRLVRTPQPIDAFSFFSTIYVWRETPAEELPAIVAHEASHIARRHSLERLFMECLKAALWWNPFVWIAVRRLTEAEEFEADSDVLAGGYDARHYMDVLYKQHFGDSPEIANGLRDSLIKKRFQMMTAPKSGRYPLLRLAGALSVVTGLLCAFTFTARAAEIRIPENIRKPFAGMKYIWADPDEIWKEVYLTVLQDGKPLPNAVVQVGNSKVSTLTDIQGAAMLRVKPGSELIISHADCQTEHLKATGFITGEMIVLSLESKANCPDQITASGSPF